MPKRTERITVFKDLSAKWQRYTPNFKMFEATPNKKRKKTIYFFFEKIYLLVDWNMFESFFFSRRTMPFFCFSVPLKFGVADVKDAHSPNV